MPKRFHKRKREQIYAMLVAADGEKCALCASTDRLEVDHLDGVRKNNSLDNLRLLCRTCNRREGAYERWLRHPEQSAEVRHREARHCPASLDKCIEEISGSKGSEMPLVEHESTAPRKDSCPASPLGNLKVGGGRGKGFKV